MSKKTQTELEQPVKGYQLDAVDQKLDTVVKQLDVVILNQAQQVTQSQLQEVKIDINDKISDEIKKVHLEYRPMKQNLTWFTRLAIGEGILLLGSVIMFLIQGSDK